ncbi:Gag-Pol polyprotein [Plecturocebus cupreus]
MLLGLLPAEDSWFTCLDLKNAFFSIGLASEGQKLFAFQWENPETGVTTQYTWTWLPQGFKNSPTIFEETLAHDLQKFLAKDLSCMLLQYAGDLLLGHPTAVGCTKGTDALLWHLEDCGYKTSEKKAQICHQQVQYLGFTIWQGECSLGAERKQVICNLPGPEARRQFPNCSTGETSIQSDKQGGGTRNPLNGDPSSSRPIRN